jgi:hypothetical protein
MDENVTSKRDGDETVHFYQSMTEKARKYSAGDENPLMGAGLRETSAVT